MCCVILACAVSEARWCTQVAALLAGRGSMEAKGQHGLTAHGHAIANGHAKVEMQLSNWANNAAKRNADAKLIAAGWWCQRGS